ncbi:MAG: hypothetical protein LIP12_17530 [Clostridiales bacterium]|nr:hypothetical protein [Clostridiales bacterium]
MNKEPVAAKETSSRAGTDETADSVRAVGNKAKGLPETAGENEEKRPVRRRTVWGILLAVVICALLIYVLDLALYPCTFMRNDIHAISTTQYDDLIVGTSHGKMNIDPDSMETVTGRSGHNACVGGEYGIDAYYIVKLAVEKQNPTRVIYEISPGYFVTEKEEGNNYLLFYHEFPLSMAKFEYFFDAIARTNFRTVLFPWYEYSLSYELPLVPETLTKKLTGDYSIDSLKSDSQEYHESGFIERYAVDTTSLLLTEPLLYEEGAVVEENMEYLKKTIEFCRENNIEFVAVTTPIPAATLGSWWDSYTAAWEYFESFFEEEGVTYLNFNTDYYFSFSHDIEYYTDYDGHMNGDAAREFSKVLAELL